MTSDLDLASLELRLEILLPLLLHLMAQKTVDDQAYFGSVNISSYLYYQITTEVDNIILKSLEFLKCNRNFLTLKDKTYGITVFAYLKNHQTWKKMG